MSAVNRNDDVCDPGRADSVPIHLVVALAAEAAPIVEAWMLERRGGGLFHWFEGELPGSRNPVQVTISGVGRARCAAAVGWCAGRDPQGASRAIWINFGIAGADRYAASPSSAGEVSSAELGDVVLASAVRDASRARLLDALRAPGSEPASWPGNDRVPCWFPPWLGRRPPTELAPASGPRLVRSTLQTVDLPEQSFDEPGAYEMEAAAFLESALPLTSMEFVQAIKVVSDTPRTGLSVIDREAVQARCAAAVPVLGRLVQEFAQWRVLETEIDGPTADWRDRWADRLRLSVSQRLQFARLVERAFALAAAAVDGEAQPMFGRLERLLERLDGDAERRRTRADGRRTLRELSRWVDDLAVGASAASRSEGEDDRGPADDPAPSAVKRS